MLFNKAEWGDSSSTRQDVWRLPAITIDESGKGVIRQGSKPTIEFFLFDEFETFPRSMGLKHTNLPIDWWHKNSCRMIRSARRSSGVFIMPAFLRRAVIPTARLHTRPAAAPSTHTRLFAMPIAAVASFPAPRPPPSSFTHLSERPAPHSASCRPSLYYALKLELLCKRPQLGGAVALLHAHCRKRDGRAIGRNPTFTQHSAIGVERRLTTDTTNRCSQPPFFVFSPQADFLRHVFAMFVLLLADALVAVDELTV